MARVGCPGRSRTTLNSESLRVDPKPESDARPSSVDEAGHGFMTFVRIVFGPVQPPRWPTTFRVLIVATVVAAICWYFGADLWHSILLGSVLTTVGLVCSTRRSVLNRDDFDWRGSEVRNRDGARNDVDVLSWSLGTHYGRIGDSALRRVQRLAELRLAGVGLDVRDPADRGTIEQLIGRSARVLLTPHGRRPPTLHSLLRCLDALDSINTSRPTAAAPLPRRRYLNLTFNRPRRARAR